MTERGYNTITVGDPALFDPGQVLEVNGTLRVITLVDDATGRIVLRDPTRFERWRWVHPRRALALRVAVWLALIVGGTALAIALRA